MSAAPVEAPKEVATAQAAPGKLDASTLKGSIVFVGDRDGRLDLWIMKASGKDAKRLTDDAHPDADLLLMDLNMPVLTGWQATAELKNDPALKHIPVIAVTAHGLGADLDRAFKAGIDDFIPKPIDFQVLLKSIQDHLADAQASAS